MMFACEDCGYVFCSPETVTVQRAGEPSFDCGTCPDCGSEYYFVIEEDE